MMLRKALPIVVAFTLFAFGCNVDDDEPAIGNNSEVDAGFNNLLECTETELPCDGACVDITTTDNCGACGNVCGDGESCVDGACALECPDGELVCDGACVDPATNGDFCGAMGDCEGANAGATCAADEVCIAGACECVTENPGFAVSAVSGVATEGGAPVSYTVVLTEQPCSPVTVDLTADDQATAEPASLTFAVDAWDTPQTVQVSAILDAVREGDHTSTITHVVTSDDEAYDGFALDPVTVDIANRVALEKVVVAADGSDPNGHSYSPDISDDGRYVVFLSNATNLTNDTFTDATITQLYWRDLETGETRLVSKGMNGPGDGNSSPARISADGQTVVFASQSTNLTMATASGTTNEIFVYDASADMLTQITQPSDGSVSGNVSISGDGDLVAFATRRRIAPEDTSSEISVYTYRISTQETAYVSVNEAGENPTNIWGFNVFSPNLSANARYIGWNSAAGNFVSPDPVIDNFHAYFKNLDTGEVRRVSTTDDMQTPCPGVRRSTSSGSPFVANDGITALYSTLCPMDGSASSYPFRQIYVWNDMMQTNTRITQSATDLPDGDSLHWGLSDDGSYGLVASRATNLSVAEGPQNPNAQWQLYVWSADTGELSGVNFGREYRWSDFGVAYRTDTAADSDSPVWAGSISGDGRYVVYATVDPMLEATTTTPMNFANIYVATLF
jgi:hypothetical protein